MGRAFKFGHNINTDAIVPGTSLNTVDPTELAKVCMHNYDPELAARIVSGDVFVAGKNFGCGSSREHAPLAIRSVGVVCVIAESFARIFYRNAINLGLPVLESPKAVAGIDDGDEVVVELTHGLILNKTKGTHFKFAPFPANLVAILEAGGLEPYYVRQRNLH